MTIEIVDFPINSMVMFNSYVKLPEGNTYVCHKYIYICLKNDNMVLKNSYEQDLNNIETIDL